MALMARAPAKRAGRKTAPRTPATRLRLGGELGAVSRTVDAVEAPRLGELNRNRTRPTAL